MIKQLNPLKRSMDRVTKDAQSMFETTAEVAEEKVGQAKGQFRSALKQAKEAYSDFQDREMESLNALDGLAHRHFYPSLSLAAGIGLLVGFLFARRR